MNTIYIFCVLFFVLLFVFLFVLVIHDVVFVLPSEMSYILECVCVHARARAQELSTLQHCLTGNVWVSDVGCRQDGRKTHCAAFLPSLSTRYNPTTSLVKQLVSSMFMILHVCLCVCLSLFFASLPLAELARFATTMSTCKHHHGINYEVVLFCTSCCFTIQISYWPHTDSYAHIIPASEWTNGLVFVYVMWIA